MAVGKVIIEPRLDTKKLDKDISQLEKRYKELTSKIEEKTMIDGVKVSGLYSDEKLTEAEKEELQQISEILDKIEEQKNDEARAEFETRRYREEQLEIEQQQLNDEELIKANIIDSYNILNQLKKKKIISDEDLELMENLKEDIREAVLEYERLTGIRFNIKGITDTKSELNKIQLQLKNINNSILGISKKVVRWGLAVFGIRSAYMAIRQAISQVINEDEKLKVQMDYIRYSLGQAIKPLAEIVVKIVKQILIGVGAILKILFGWDIYSNATVNNFKKANSSANKLKRTLAGFDEMNVLNENGTVGALGSSLDGITDISKEVDKISEKIKTWFWGSDIPAEQNLISALKRTPALIKRYLWDEGLNPIYNKYIKPEIDLIIDYTEESLKQTEWLWGPFYNGFKKEIDNIKIYWQEFVNLLKPIIQPFKTWWTDFWKGIKNSLAPYLNDIIKAINYTFGIFGIHLDEIQIESENTGGALEENIDGAVKDIDRDASNLSSKYFSVNIVTNEINNAKNSLQGILDKLKEITSKVWKPIVDVTSQGASNIFSSIGGSIKKGISFIFGAKGMIYNPPKLAVGGIINRPGRGIPIGSAIGGERGAEAVVPLTDSQQMALLGEAIGRYVNIELTSILEADGRTLARVVNKANQNNNFLMNR